MRGCPQTDCLHPRYPAPVRQRDKQREKEKQRVCEVQKERQRQREIEREIDYEKEEGKLNWMLSMSKRKRIYKYENGWKRSALKIFNFGKNINSGCMKTEFQKTWLVIN